MQKTFERTESHNRLLSPLSRLFTFLVLSFTILWVPQISFAVPPGYDYQPAKVDPHSAPSQNTRLNNNSNSQEQRYNLDSVATFQFTGINGSDTWGWRAPNGDQYAIMGVQEGVVFINVTTMEVVDTIPAVGGPCLWQDIKTYQHYAYSVSECNGNGLMVMDMSFLPDSVHFVRSVPIATDTVFGETQMSSHNISIDTAKGFAYFEGWGGPLSIFIHDLADPENPQLVGYFGESTTQIHDMHVRNDTAYVADAPLAPIQSGM